MQSDNESRRGVYKVSLVLALIGAPFILLSVGADLLRLDLTPGFGLVQIAGVLIGVTLLVAAGYLFLAQPRTPGQNIPLLADVGLRMGLTGLLACYVSGLADAVGVGTHGGARYERPVFGHLQMIGLAVGLVITAAGLLLFGIGSRQRQSDEDTQQPI